MAETAQLTATDVFAAAGRPFLSTVPGADVEDWGTLLLTFDDGTVAQITGGDTVLGGIRNQLAVYGGALASDVMRSSTARNSRPRRGGEWSWGRPWWTELQLTAVSRPIRLTARRPATYRDAMARRRVRLSSKWPTFAATARVFKLSAATRRRISREVEEFLKTHKDALADNGRGTAVKPHRRAARKPAYHPVRVSHAR